MMITNIKTKFFWTTLQKNFSFRIAKITLLLLLGLVLIIGCNKDNNLTIHAFKTPTGWGYAIVNQEKIIIKQTIIPVISELKSFKTKNDALKVGNLVLQRLDDDLSPTVTKKDLIALNIKT